MKYDHNIDSYINKDINFIINNPIIEYDMISAGLSVIKESKALNVRTIESLELMEKQKRNIEIGLLQRDNVKLVEAMVNGFAEARRNFITANDVKDNDIIAVRKDAIFTTKYCNVLSFNHIQFDIKNEYTSFVRFPNSIEVYLRYPEIDTKGLGKYSNDIHKVYMSRFIAEIINGIEHKDQSVKRKLNKFLLDYKSGKLDDYYPGYTNDPDKDNVYNIKNIIIPLFQLGVQFL